MNTGSKTSLTRQGLHARLSDLFPEKPAKIDMIATMLDRGFVVEGKSILELACDPDFALGSALLRLGARHVECINVLPVAKTPPPGLTFRQCDAASLPHPSHGFDGVVGFACLEHMSPMDGVAREIRRVLKPGGQAFLQGAPLWGSKKGHHIWITIDGTDYTLQRNNPVPDFAHLRYTADECEEVLVGQGIPSSHARKIVTQIYTTVWQNRLCAEQLVDCFSSVFEDVRFIRYFDKDADGRDIPLDFALDPKLHAYQSIWGLVVSITA